MTEDNAEIPLFASAIDMIKAEAAMKNVAKLIVTFQRTLVGEGFSGRDALSLCNTWLNAATNALFSKTGHKQ